MKKFYTDPSMEVNAFDVENVVTASGGTGTAVDAGDLTPAAGYSTTTVDFSELGIVF